MDERADIILFEKGKYISYANCGLPYYIGGIIEEREKLFVQTPDTFSARFNVDVRVESEVVHIDTAKKVVKVQPVGGEAYEESYDKLVLSTGASPVKPPLPGIDQEGIFTLRNVEDTDRIKAYATRQGVKRAVVVGGGFIGLEMAENLHELGAKVSIVEMGNQVMAPIDYSMAALVHDHLVQKGVNLYLEEAVASFERTSEGIAVAFKSGKRVMADVVILSIGVRPETRLAKEAGLTIGEMGGVAVNDYLQTSDESVYAIGDVIEFRHPITGQPWLNYLAGPANRQGRIVADNVVHGNKVTYEGAIGTAIAKVFDMTVATTGLPAKRLTQAGIAYVSSTTHSSSHAGYYPDALPLSIKITFDRTTGRLYGAQVVGYDGVDKRIDTMALIIKHQGTIYDLMQVEHAYAPPFSSAKDPVAIAGYVAENIIDGYITPFYWRDLTAENSAVRLLDVRTSEEFRLRHIAGAQHIPLDELRDRLSELPKDKPVYLYCAVGIRGNVAARILMQHGYTDVRNLSGGYKTYIAATTPVPVPTDEADDALQADAPCSVPQRAEGEVVNTVRVDACGLQCPGPILKMKKTVDSLLPGERVEVVSTDPGFPRDAEAWSRSTGHRLISQTSHAGKATVVIEKRQVEAPQEVAASGERNRTFIMFSDDLDKALATFVLANGAAATGQKVTIFFTFWGLNVIKKVNKPKVKKEVWGRMFGMMLPSSSLKLKLSKMNMGGMGSKMMRHIMNVKGIDSLESLRAQALESGVEFIACQMSMDVMGVDRAELLDEVTIGGVATYMERADKANVNLFI